MTTLPPPPTVTLRPVRPAEDAALLHAWVTQPRARFWGMRDHSVEDVAEVYGWLDTQPTHAAYLAEVAGVPCGIFQTYDPAAEPVGLLYPREPGDLGVHLFVAPAEVPGIRDLGAAVGLAGAALCFADPSVHRLVAEPDARNRAALALLHHTGWELGDQVDLPDKRAQLAFLRRADAAGLLG